MYQRVAAILALGIIVASSAAIADDSLDRRLKSIAPGGKDCGRIGERGTPRPDVVACVTQQFKANKPFWARLDSFAEDSSGGLGLVLEDRGNGRGGAFFIVEFDKKGCGGRREAQAFCVSGHDLYLQMVGSKCFVRTSIFSSGGVYPNKRIKLTACGTRAPGMKRRRSHAAAYPPR
jgi:hypothetical protein